MYNREKTTYIQPKVIICYICTYISLYMYIIAKYNYFRDNLNISSHDIPVILFYMYIFKNIFAICIHISSITFSKSDDIRIVPVANVLTQLYYDRLILFGAKYKEEYENNRQTQNEKRKTSMQ